MYAKYDTPLAGKIDKLQDEAGSTTFLLAKDGTVWGAGNGATYPTFGEENNRSNPYYVQVNAATLKFEELNVHLEPGESKTVKTGQTEGINLYYDDLSIYDVTFSSSDETIVAVDANGKITAKAVGEVDIKATNSIGMETTCRVKVSTPRSRAKVDPGYRTAVALKSDGSVWAWGQNAKGALGNGTTELSVQPTQVLDVDGKTPLTNVIDIAAQGNNDTNAPSDGGIALKKDGTVVTWGGGSLGQLGNGGTADSVHAVQVIKEDGSPLTDIVQIVAAQGHGAALDKYGKVYLWGNNGRKELAVLGTANIKTATQVPLVKDIIGIQEAYYGTYLISKEHRLYGIGDNTYYVFGGETKENGTVYMNMENFKKIVGGCQVTFAIKEDDTLWAIGQYTYGQLGDGRQDTSNAAKASTTWVQVKSPDGKDYLTNVKDIGGSYGGFALTYDNKLYSWGYNTNLQLGLSKTGNVTLPTEVKDVNGVNIGELEPQLPEVSLSYSQIFTSKNGDLYAAGQTANKTFGVTNGDNKQLFEPIFESYLAFEERQPYVKVGNTFKTQLNGVEGFNIYGETPSTEGVTYVSSDETVATVNKTTGEITGIKRGQATIVATNKDGQQARCIVSVISNKPEAITLPQTAHSGAGTTYVLKEDGTVWTIGYNTYGELGDGTKTARYELDQVKISETTYLENVIRISPISAYNMIAITKNGEAYSFGYGTYGQLGLGDSKLTNILYATKIPGIQGAIDVSMSRYHSSKILTNKGELYTFGQYTTYSSMQGDGKGLSTTPRKIENINNVVSVSGGYQHIVALKGDGTAWAWGVGTDGALGNGKSATSSYPVQVATKDGPLTNLASAVGLDKSSGAIDMDGNGYTWGLNANGQLGDGTKTNKPYATKIFEASDENGKMVSLGSANSAITYLLNNGKVYVSGANSKGQLSQGNTTAVAGFKVAMTEDGNEFENGLIISRGSDPNTISVIQENGSVWTAGANASGELMLGDTTDRKYLTKVGSPTFAAKEYKIVVGLHQTHQLEKENFWYENEFNVFNEHEKEIGTLAYESLNPDIAVVDVNSGLVLGSKEGTTKIAVTNTLNGEIAYVIVKVVDGENEPQVIPGNFHTLAIKSDGTLWGWGANNYGQLGQGYATPTKEPVAIKGPNGEAVFSNIKMATAGYYYSAVLTKDGEVYTWGYNEKGQLGDGTKVNKNIPTKVNLPEKIVKIASLQQRTVALGESGKVYVWGENFTTTPTQLKTTARIVDISGGYILREDKKVYLMTNLKKSITGMENIIAIDGGYQNHLLALTAEGNVYSYGYNYYGQGGQGTTQTTTAGLTTPALVKSPDGLGILENIVEVHTTLNGAIARDIDGNVYTWGYNGFGQIGNDTTKNTTLPYLVENLPTIEGVPTAWGYTNIVADIDGYVWSVGRGEKGVKGDGTVTNSKQFSRIGKVIIEPNKPSISMKVGETQEVLTKVKNTFNLKRDEINTQLTYRIVDTDIARVDGLNIIAKQTGRTYLIIESKELNASATVEIQVLADGAKTLPKVEAANDYTVALKADGTVWTWGTNKLGQLGTGDLEERTEPYELTSIPGITKDISANKSHTLVLAETGEVYAFGYNYYGQIGNGTTTNSKTPVKVMMQDGKEIVPLKDIIKVKAGKNESFAIDKNFDLWAWGWQYGKYATKVAKLEGTDIIDVTEDYIIKNNGLLYTLKDLKEIETVERVKQLNEGFNHTVILTETGKVYSIGKNKYGQLGNGNTLDSTVEAVGVRQTDGQNLLENIKQVHAGEYSTIAITKDNKVYVWGYNKDNRLGQGNDFIQTNLPVLYEGVENAMLVSAGYHHTEIADQEGFVWNFGQGTLGQLGNREKKNSILPVMVGNFELQCNVNSITISMYEEKEIKSYVEYFNLLKNGDEDVEYKSYNEGIATITQEGIVTGIAQGNTTIEVKQKGTDNILLIQVEVLKAKQIAKPAVETNGSHALILKADGSVYSFGQNTYGQLGDRSIELKDGTIRVEFSKNTKITQISAGEEHNIALDLNGGVWTWGRNNQSQLGVTGAYSSIPVKVSLPEKAVKVTAGNYSSYAIGASGKVYSWGYNLNGELGIGTYQNVSKPTEIVNIQNVADISAGANHAILVNKKGEVYVTGNNTYGQLGIEKQKVNQFTKVDGIQNIVQVEAGDNHNIVKTANDEIYTWGSNIYGQLGLNDRQNKTKPVKLEGKSNIIAISAGKQNSILLENTGNVYTVGANNYGQIGDATTTVKQEYVLVNKIPDGIDVSMGNTFAMAIREDGTVWAWGDYNHGMEETVSKMKSKVPVMVGKDTSNIDNIEMVLKTSEMKNISIGTKEKFNVYYDDTKYASDYTYESLNPQIATINEVGTIIGVRIGTTWVRAIDKATKEVLTTMVRVIDNNKVAAPQIEGGNGFTVALKGNGTIWTWGYNPYGALGDGTYETALVPRQANIIETYRNISVGSDHALALRNNGTVWSWGSNSNGQLGTENHKNSQKLVQVHGLENIKMIAAGSKHSIAVDKNGIIYGFGSNANGQLGLPSKDDVVTPTIIAMPDVQVISVSAGNVQTVYATLDGNVYGMGEFLNGKLEGISNVIKVAVGSSHIVLLKDDGTIWEYKNGILTQIPNINNAIDISAQNYTSTYQDTNEKTYTWGTNVDGQLGTDDTVDKIVPTEVTKYGTSTFRVGAGYDNTYIIRNDGFVYASGKNNYGQLGNSTQNQSLVHTLVGDREFKLIPDNKIMTVKDIEELEIECKTFNMFFDDKKDREEYEWKTSDEGIVSVDTGILTAKSVGTATIEATDKVTGETKQAIRVVMPVDENRIKTLTVDGENAKVVGDKAYSVTIYSDKDLASLKVATFDITDKISLDGGNNYSLVGEIVQEIEVPEKQNHITIRIQTANGTEIDYDLEIIKKSKNMNLADLTVNGKDAIAKGINTYEVILEEHEDRLDIIANAEHDMASVSIDGGQYQIKGNTYETNMAGIMQTIPITVKAESGITTTYLLNIYKKSALVDISEIRVNSKEATKTDETSYNVVIDRDANTSSIVATATYELAKIAIGAGEAKVKTSTEIVSTSEEVTEVEIHVTAQIEDENRQEEISKTYTLHIYKARINAKIDLLTVNGTVIAPSGNRFDAYLPNNVKQAEVRVVTALDTDKVKIDELEEGIHDVTRQVGTEELTNTYTIRVTDGETGAIQSYTLTIRKPSADTSIKEITGIAKDYETKATLHKDDDSIYELRVPDNYEQIDLSVITNNKISKVGFNEQELNANTITKEVNVAGENVEIPVIVEAEDGSQKEYTIKVIKISTDSSLARVLVGGKEATKSDTEENTYDFILEDALTDINVEAISTYDLASVSIENGEYKVKSAQKEITIDSREVKVPIRVKSENGDMKQYTLKIHGLPDNTNAIFTVDGEEGTFIPSKNKYVFKVNKKTTNHTFKGVMEDPKAKIQIETQAQNVGTATLALTNDDIGREFEVYVTSQNGLVTETVIIEIAEKSSNADVTYVRVDGKILVPDENGNYQAEVKHDVEASSIEVKLDDTNAKVSIASEEEQLAEGQAEIEITEETTTVPIKVTAEDGTIKNVTLTIKRLEGEVGIQTLSVDNIVLTPAEDGNYYYTMEPKDTATISVTAQSTKSTISIDGEDPTASTQTKVVDILLEDNNIGVLVTAEDGTEQYYEVIVHQISSDNLLKEVLAAGIESELISVTGENTFEIKVPSDSEQIPLRAIANSNYASIKLKDEDDTAYQLVELQRTIDLTDEETKVILTVKAENGTTKEYEVSIIKMSNNTNLDQVLVNGNAATKSTTESKTYDYYLTDALMQVDIKAIAADARSKISIAEQAYTLAEQETTIDITESVVRVKIEVKSEENVVIPYYLNIHTLPDNVNAIFTADGDEAIYDIFTDTYILKVDPEMAEHNIQVQLEDNLATVKLAEQAPSIGVANKTITNAQIGDLYDVMVTSQNKLVNKNYKLKVIAKETDNSIYKLMVNEKELQKDHTGNYELKVSHDVDLADIELIAKGKFAHVKIGDLTEDIKQTSAQVELTEETTVIPLQVTAENGKVANCNLTIIRMNGNTEIANISVNGVVVNKDEDGFYRYSVDADSQTAEVAVELANNVSKVSIDGEEEKQGRDTKQVETEYENNPVTIVVTAEDATTKTHMLIIHKVSKENTLKRVTAAGILEDQIEKTADDQYVVKVPYNQESIELTAVATHELANIKLENEDDEQYEKASKIFTIELANTNTEVKLLVRAENGDIKPYTINIVKIHVLDVEYVNANGEALILDEENSRYDDYVEAKDNVSLEIKVKDKTTKIELLQGDQVLKAANGVLQLDVPMPDQELELSFRVTLEDDSETKEYTMHFTKKSQDNSLEYVKCDEQTINAVDGNYHIVVNREDAHVIEIKTTNPNAKINLTNGEEAKGIYHKQINMKDIEEINDTITVTSQNGEVATYPLTIRKTSNNIALQEITVNGNSAKIDTENEATYIVYTKRDSTEADISAITQSLYANVGINDEQKTVHTANTVIPITQESTTVKINVTAEDGTEKEYTLIIEKESTNTNIELLQVNGVTAVKDENGQYNASILDNLTTIPIYVKTENAYAQIEIHYHPDVKEGENTVSVPINPEKKTQSFDIVVTAQNGNEKLYTLNVTRKANNTEVEYLKINGKVVNATNDTYEAIIDYTDQVAQIEIKTADEEANISYSDRMEKGHMTISLPTVDTPTEMEFEVISEWGTPKTYKVNLIKKSNDMTLKEVSVNGNKAQKQEDGNYYIEVLDTVEKGNVTVKTNNEKASVRIGFGEETLSVGTAQVELLEKETEVMFTVKSEAGNTTPIKLTIKKVSNNTQVEILTVDEEEVTQYDETKFAYQKIVDNTKEGYYVLIMAKDPNATVELGQEKATGSLRTIVPIAGDAKEVKFLITAENGDTQEYSLTIIKASNNINIDTVELNDVSIAVTDPERGIYEKMIPKLADTIKVKVVTENDYATVKIGDTKTCIKESVQDISLDIKENIITIPVVITAADGYTVKTYNIILTRGENNTDIVKLTVDGKQIDCVNSKFVANITGDSETAEVNIKLSDENASINFNEESKYYQITSQVRLEGLTTIKDIIVTAQDGTIKEYTLEIHKLMSIAGIIQTPENINKENIAQIHIYRSSDTREINDKDNPREVVASGESTPDGKFDIVISEIDTYDVVITKAGYLSHTIRRIKVEQGKTTTIGTKELIAGDVNHTGLIEADDLAMIVDHYGKLPVITESSSREEIEIYENEKPYDLNEDGIVNKLDKAIVKKNYDKQKTTEEWEDPNAEVTKMAKRMVSSNMISDTQNQHGFIKPIATNYTITSPYGARVNPITKVNEKHTGIDISGVHHAEVLTVADGEVTWAGVQNGYGNCIEVKHIVNGETIYSFYAHLSEIKVQIGDKVTQGQVIALEGGDPANDPNPGDSTGHHLHFEMRAKSGYGNDIDPTNYIQF